MLLGNNGEIKLADFGLAIKLGPNKNPKDCCGTEEYLSPEMVDGLWYDE